jgi:hypothetical protein
MNEKAAVKTNLHEALSLKEQARARAIYSFKRIMQLVELRDILYIIGTYDNYKDPENVPINIEDEPEKSYSIQQYIDIVRHNDAIHYEIQYQIMDHLLTITR